MPLSANCTNSRRHHLLCWKTTAFFFARGLPAATIRLSHGSDRYQTLPAAPQAPQNATSAQKRYRVEWWDHHFCTGNERCTVLAESLLRPSGTIFHPPGATICLLHNSNATLRTSHMGIDFGKKHAVASGKSC